MTHPPHLDSSLIAEGPRSHERSARYAPRWEARNPAVTVSYFDLGLDSAPHLDNVALLSEAEITSAE